MTPPAKRAPAKKRAPKPPATSAEAARDEVDSDTEPKTLKYGAIDLVLPPSPPGTMLFDLISLEGTTPDVLSLFRMLKSFLDWEDDNGVKYEQTLLVRNEIGVRYSSIEGVADAAMDLFNQVTGLYGMGLGESEASPSS